MNWKIWQRDPRPKTPDSKPRLILRGTPEAELVAAFGAAVDNGLFAATLEQADQDLMELVNELVNESDGMTTEKLREHVGRMRGLTDFREKLVQREEEARKRAAGVEKTET